MKIPVTPPPFRELMDEAIASKRLTEFFSAAGDPDIDAGYYHWDKLRHLAPPHGLSHREWWMAIKQRRRGQFRSVPIVDTKSRTFQFTSPDPIAERLREVDLHIGGSVATPDALTNAADKKRYVLRSLMDEAIASSLLEGAAITREKAQEILQTKRKPRTEAERMVVNNYDTMQRIGPLKNKNLTPDLICEIHRWITKDTLEDPEDAGHIRTADRQIDVGDLYGQTFHVPPAAEELPERLKAICQFANERSTKPFLHPVIRAIILHFALAYDHPFVDGNGRTARALFYWCMLRHGYYLCEYISISEFIHRGPARYGRAYLYAETDDSDLTYFILYHLDILDQAVRSLHKYLDRKVEDLERAESNLSGVTSLNQRQRALLMHALSNPNHTYTIKGHMIRRGVVHQTARTDLLGLAEEGLLEGFKVGKQWQFRPVADLEERLRV